MLDWPMNPIGLPFVVFFLDFFVEYQTSCLFVFFYLFVSLMIYIWILFAQFLINLLCYFLLEVDRRDERRKTSLWIILHNAYYSIVK